jgi:hypothetical protein
MITVSPHGADRVNPLPTFIRTTDRPHSSEFVRGSYQLLVGAGVSVLWNDRIATYVDYDGELGRTNYESNTVTAGLRDRNTTIAIRLLPLFEAEPRAWKAVAFLNHVSADPDASLTQHLAAWRARCPADLRPFVTRLAVAFGVKL